MSYGLLGSVFNFLDPILDTIDPMHNKVQTWTTGSKETDGQRPYFETIAPLIIDAFLPGVGSAVGAVDKASTGNWGGAALSALGAVGGMGGFSGAGEATQATQATPALSSTAGEAAGSVSSGADIANAANASTAVTDVANTSSFGSVNNFGQTPTNELGYQGMSSVSGSPTSTQFMTGSTPEYAQFGGAGQSLASTSADASALGSTGIYDKPWYSKLTAPSTGKAAGLLGEQMIKQQSQAQQRNEEMKARAQQAMNSVAGESGGQAKSYSVQQASPYAQFNGGFHPKRYGANIRQTNGLLG